MTDRLRPTRRQLLAGVTAGVGTLAGCLGGDGDNTTDDGGDNNSQELVNEELRLGGDIVLNTAFPVRLADPDTEEVVANVHYHPEFNHWHRMPLSIPLEEQVRYRVLVVDSNEQEVPLGSDGPLTVDLEPAENTPRDIVDFEVEGPSVDLYGRRPGTGDFVFALANSGDRVWQGSLLSIRVEG